jgi:hypothetical protein
MYLQTARSLLKSGRKVLTQSKQLNKQIEYISELTTLMSDPESVRCKATSREYFRDEKNLYELLKWNALYRIGRSL